MCVHKTERVRHGHFRGAGSGFRIFKTSPEPVNPVFRLGVISNGAILTKPFFLSLYEPFGGFSPNFVPGVAPGVSWGRIWGHFRL